MNAPQHNLLNTAQSVSAALATITTTATPVPPALTAAHAALNATLGEIQDIAVLQGLPVTGVTRDRDTAFAAAAEATLIMAGLVSSYAKAAGLADLEARVRLTPSQLARGRFHARVLLMEQVHEAASSVVEHLADFDVTPATLSDLKAKIDATHAQLHAPRSAIAARRVATEKLAESFAHLDGLLHRIDPLITARRLTDPDSHKLYQAARLVIDRSSSSTSATPAAPASTIAAPQNPEPAAPLTGPPATPHAAKNDTAPPVAEAIPPAPAAPKRLALSHPANADPRRPGSS